ncbi:MAG: ferrous iron transporter B [Clostridiales bacterium]|nr:ferrous iron transporter B [Clostridiales bacterium]
MRNCKRGEIIKTFALAGNPNSGKTTLFNALTGATAHVGNWPGVTVDKREGVYKKGSEPVDIVDLPGIYSLSPYTPEEVISRNYILDEKPYGIINIVDATNLERNLYLTTQLLEMDVPVIVALNMIDAVERSGDKIDAKALEAALGVPVVPISALRGEGIKELMSRAIAMGERKGETVLKDLSREIGELTAYFEDEQVSSPLFHAIKLLERDEIELQHRGAEAALDKAVSASSKAKKSDEGDEAAAAADAIDYEAEIADERYKYISTKLSPAKTRTAPKGSLSKSDKIDKVLTHRVWAIPIFIVIMFFIFHLTFSENLFYLNGFTEGQAWMPSLVDCGLAAEIDGEVVYNNFGVELLAVFYDGAIFSPGVILTNFLNLFLDHISDGIVTLMENGGAAEWAVGLVGDGILGGIFAVLGFLPQILVLFLFFSILEDSGYMARIAFVLDRIFRRFGVSGRAFMPMIMGFGCSVPAAINTRTLADEKERTATIRVIPFFSCGAKLPILTAVAGGIVAAFGIGNADAITFLMYLLGICAAIVCILLMRNTSLKGETPPFIMELPAYHAPRFKNLMIHLWDKTKHFVKKAFTIIFASTVVIWLFSHLNWNWHYLPDTEMQNSIIASIGKFIQPIFTPLGFGSQLGTFGWVFAVAAITGLIAKENVIATFTTLAICIGAYFGEGTEEGIEEMASLINAIQSTTGISTQEFTAALISFIAFNMTTIPCFAACATAKGELKKGKFKWTVLFWLASSYIIGAMVYTVGAWVWPLAIWLVLIAAITALIVLRNLGKFDITKIFRRKRKNKVEAEK